MKPIVKEEVQQSLDSFKNKTIYLHLETTNGAYASHLREKMVVGAYIRNGEIQYSEGKIQGEGPYRIGLKMEIGWIYAEGLTDWKIDEKGRLLIAGHDPEGKLAVAFQISETPFE
ncbi:YojF family protein [Bacillus suaedaesalsae]|uniref:YojF family protein n=1 Tax=Bacillus suaedaesalsae TaxID=2810349 RepID=A0ABS2DLN9_9BACI|nr:YojF family protein [Bacillus suaedaesalsae]MBM6619397.1 YojF family protein [Bacillus suaedaesalsae]